MAILVTVFVDFFPTDFVRFVLQKIRQRSDRSPSHLYRDLTRIDRDIDKSKQYTSQPKIDF